MLKRLVEAQTIVDESWAVALKRRGGFDVRVLIGAGALLYLTWNAGTAVGLVLGNAIGDANRLGLDAAFPALFLALLIPQLTGRRELTAALLGGGIALALIPFAPAGVPIVAGAAGCLVGWTRGGAGARSRRERGLAVRARRRRGHDRVQGDRARCCSAGARCPRGSPPRSRCSHPPCSRRSSSRRRSAATARSSRTRGWPASAPVQWPSPCARRCWS